VPRVGLLGSPASELDQPPGEPAVARLLRDEHLTAPELLRRPEQVVPEVVHELVELLLGRRGRVDARRLTFEEAEAIVVEHAEAARENGVGIRLDLGGNGRGHDREVDLVEELLDMSVHH
jgi:hypothetical protein